MITQMKSLSISDAPNMTPDQLIWSANVILDCCNYGLDDLVRQKVVDYDDLCGLSRKLRLFVIYQESGQTVLAEKNRLLVVALVQKVYNRFANHLRLARKKDTFRYNMSRSLTESIDDLINKPDDDAGPQYFLHRWNAEISSYSLEEYRKMRESQPDGFMLNWSLWDWQKVREGDEYFMMRVDGDHPGIVFYGDFYDEPWEEESWRGDGKMIHYMDIVCRKPGSHDCPLLSFEQLTETLPEIDWLHGHSGVLLTREQGEKLKHMLKNYNEGNNLVDKS